MINTNQVGISNVVGALDLAATGVSHALSVKIENGFSGTLAAGAFLDFFDGGANDVSDIPLVTELSDAAKPAKGGVIMATLKNSEFSAGSVVQAMRDGDVTYLEASEPINRGASVAPVVGTAGKIKNRTAGEAQIGIAIDKASEAGDLIRIIIRVKEA